MKFEEMRAAQKRKDPLLPRRHLREDEGCGTEDAHLDAFEGPSAQALFGLSRSRQIAGWIGPPKWDPGGLVPDLSLRA